MSFLRRTNSCVSTLCEIVKANFSDTSVKHKITSKLMGGFFLCSFMCVVVVVHPFCMIARY